MPLVLGLTDKLPSFNHQVRVISHCKPFLNLPCDLVTSQVGGSTWMYNWWTSLPLVMRLWYRARPILKWLAMANHTDHTHWLNRCPLTVEHLTSTPRLDRCLRGAVSNNMVTEKTTNKCHWTNFQWRGRQHCVWLNLKEKNIFPRMQECWWWFLLQMPHF